MSKFRALIGIEDEEDRSVRVVEPTSPIESDGANECIYELHKQVTLQGRQLEIAPLGMYRHLPGVQTVLLERWVDNKQQKNVKWVIRSIDIVASTV